MGKVVLISNFFDGYIDIIKKVSNNNCNSLCYIPSRTELGEIYYKRIVKAYQKLGIESFLYADIDQNYSAELDKNVLKSDILFMAGGDDPFILKNIFSRKYNKLLNDYYEGNGIIIGLCAGASILSDMTIVADYDGEKFVDLKIIPMGIGLIDILYYSRFDENCDLSRIMEFSLKYNKKVLTASLNSVVIIDKKK